MQLSASYSSGFEKAFLDVGIEKDAGLRDKAKAGFMGLAMALGGLKGGTSGARKGSDMMLQGPSKTFFRLMNEESTSGKLVNSRKFMKQFAPDLHVLNGQEFAESIVRAGIKDGTYPKNINVKKEARKLANDPYIADVSLGSNGYYNPDFGVIVAEKVSPSILAHEALGHGRQHKHMGDKAYREAAESTNTLLSKALGRSYDFENDAWQEALKAGVKVDPEVMNAALDAYKAEQRGTAVGGVLGGLAGAAATGLGLLALRRPSRVIRRIRR